MKASNRKHFFAAIVTAFLLILTAAMLATSVSVVPSLLLFDESGQKLTELPLVGGSFVHCYIHSIHKTPVDEEFIVSGKELKLVRLRYDAYGVGMPSDGGEAFRIEDGRFVIDMSRSFARLDIRVSHLPDHGLLIDGNFHPFTEWVPVESLITLKAGRMITIFPGGRLFHERTNNQR
ncbi:MAG: hypothetical protein CVV53_10235 [Spirochaetae bacterium HGW-Spirochaetae-9]|nr:MAG: hypothetical protein CVV53_10235 [Spirochaetae bacterium HGW-Spirochaetae-9]